MILRSRIAVSLLLLFGLVYPFKLLYEQHRGWRSGADPDYIGPLDQRFRVLSGDLPARGVVGFVTGHPPGSFEAIRDYYVAQFALAPRILIQGDKASAVIHDEEKRLWVSGVVTP